MTRKWMIGTTLATVATAGFLAVATMANAGNGDGWPGPGMHRDHDGRHFMGGLIVVVVAALIGLAVWLVLRRRPAVAAAGTPAAAVHISPTAGAEAILAERLARSEISVDDYRATLAALRDSSAPSSRPTT